jgi:hypothetical protein
MHPEFTLIAAQQHIADLHRAADQWRWARGGCRPRPAPPRRRCATWSPAQIRSEVAASE